MKLTSDTSKKRRLSRYKIVASILVAVFMFGGLWTIAGLAKAGQYDGLGNNYPIGTSSAPATVAGVITFSATMTVTSGESYSSPTFIINGGSVTPTVTTIKSSVSYTEYKLTYNYNTGNLANGEYGWRSEVQIGGTVYYSPSSSTYDYFQVSNYITISYTTPTSNQVVQGTANIFVTATPSSTLESVSSVSSSLYTTTIPLTHGSGNQWSGSINVLLFASGPTVIKTTATGTNGISGVSNQSIIINSPSTNTWTTVYNDFSGVGYTTPTPPIMSGSYTNEGNYPFLQGQLPLSPNGLTKSINIEQPTIPDVQSMWLPITTSPYYDESSTQANNWTSQSSNPLTWNSAGVTTGNNSPYGTYSVDFLGNSHTYANFTTQGTPTNLSAGSYSIGFLFNAPSNNGLEIGGISYSGDAFGIFAYSVTTTTFKIEIQFSNSSGHLVDVISAMIFNINTWYSFVITMNHLTMPELQSGNPSSDLQLYADGANISYGVTTTSTGGYGIMGIGNNFVNSISPASNFQMSNFFVANTIYSTKQINEIIIPEAWQIYATVQPPFYTVTENYAITTITNGSQPWSSVSLYIQNIQPTSLAQLEVSLTSGFGPQSFFNYVVRARYTPYLSVTTYNFTASLNTLTLPLFSTIDIQVFNSWGQVVGHIDNYTLSSQSSSMSIYLDLTLLSFQFVNTAETSITLSANGISETEFGQALVANNSQYFYSATVFSNGNSTPYTGNVSTDTLLQPLTIYANPPIVSLTVLVYAYNQSGLGAIGSLAAAGSPSINLFINHKPFQTGETYSTSIDSTVNVLITDQMNQTLYNESYTLLNSVNTLVVKITKPSWILSITNDEQLAPKANSTLATEIVNITNKTSGINHIFTNSVGQTLELYLLQGNYSLYLHDNATFKTSINLNSSQFYVLFGQRLLTLNEWLNKTNEIINNSAKLDVVVLRQSTMMLPFVHTSFQFTITYPNGTALSNSQIKGFMLNGSFVIYKLNSSVAQTVAIKVINSTIYANFTTGPVDSYTYVLQGHLIINAVTWGKRYSGDFEVNLLTNSSNGLIIKVSGPSIIQINTSNMYTISLYYQLNNTPLSHGDTQRIFKNMTIDVFYHGAFFGVINPKYNATTNLITFTVNMSAIGSYIIDVIISPTNITGNAHANGQLSPNINVQYANPYGPTTLQQIAAFIGQFGGYLGVAVTFAYVFVVAYRRIRRRRLAEEDDERSAETYEVSFAYKDLINSPSWEAVPPASKIIISRMKKDAIKKMTLDLLGQKNQQVNEIIREMRKANREAQKQQVETQLHFRRLKQDTDKAVGDVRGLSYDVKKRIDDVE